MKHGARFKKPRRRPGLFRLSAVSDGCLYPPIRTSSSSDDETWGTCSPSEARETEMRVLLKAVAAPDCEFKLLSSSVTSTLYWPLPSSATLSGVAEVRISAFSGAEIGASPWEKERKRRS